ncbi:MAG TPA: c-type cytochrome [Streptosporangiaceae bacterium]|nr:c-type cytochrome [Streptosporangiaceae bacterium]
MSWITARRRHPAATYALVGLVLVLIGLGYTVITNGNAATAASPTSANPAQIAEGRNLFVENCATCHGLYAEGRAGQAPSLIGVGAAAVDFQVSTGRMPAASDSAENIRKPDKFTPAETHALAAYIESIGGGPPIPSAAAVNPAAGTYGLGQQLFVADCAACHNFVGAGGDLTYGKFAPPLTASTPTQIYEAMLTGPEAMPVFNDLTITPQQKRDIITYVTQVRSQPNPGGFSLGRIGPVTEGLVAFLGLLLFLVLAALWITAKHGKAHE